MRMPVPPDYSKVRRDQNKRLILTVGLTFGLGLLAFHAGPVFSFAFIVLTMAYAAWGAWSIRPGKCVTCGERTMLNLPVNIHQPAPRRAWWDLRHSSRKDSVFICIEHCDEFMRMRMMLEMRRLGLVPPVE
jgi:hypothetical protein